MTGYDFARDIVDWTNAGASWNESQNIPPNSSIPVISKNYRFVLDGVYFHRNDSHFLIQLSNPNTYNAYKVNPDEVMQVLLVEDPNNPNYNSVSVRGYASSTSHNSTYKYTEVGNAYDRYVSSIVNATPYPWALHGIGSTITHELGHLFGLFHTVYSGGNPCPITPSCDDDCPDTVTAYEMVTNPAYNYVYPTPTSPPYNHPACRWGLGNIPGCSNNIMDYTGANALSPCQVETIHCGLDGGLKDYRVCDAVVSDNTVCDLGYPQIAYYGKKVTVEECGGNSPTLAGQEEANVYFSDEVEFYPGFEVEGQATFEVFHVAACP